MSTASVSEVEYRDIPGFPGYRVGSDGTVWSCRASAGKPAWRRLSAHWYERDRRFQVLLSTSGKRRTMGVGNLVLLAFVGPKPPGLECCHESGDARDNRPGNLRWDTHASNMKDKERHGTLARGEKVGTAKLDPDKVREIRRLLAEGVSYRRIASGFGVSTYPVFGIANGTDWAHV